MREPTISSSFRQKSTTHSPRFALPFLAPGQAQKELHHNEAVQLIEALLCPAVEEAGLVAPPANPLPGNCYVVGEGATGDWAGHDNALACFTEGGWRFIAPVDSMQLVDKITGETMSYEVGAWQRGVVRARQVQVNGQRVLDERQPAITDPAGGPVVDSECRAAVLGILAALRAHGLIG